MDQRNPTFSRYKFTPPKGSVLKYIKNQGYIAVPQPVQKAAAAAVAPQKPFNPAAAIGNEGIFASDSAQIKADNEVAQKQRDNAVKALQFQFNDPSNPFSQMGELTRALAETKGNFNANRAARGVQTSGGTTLGQMQIGHDYGKSVYDATNQLNSGIGQLDNSLAETLRANAARQVGALTDATGRLIDNGVGIGSGGGPGAGSPIGASPGGVPAPGVTGQVGLPPGMTRLPNGSVSGANPATQGIPQNETPQQFAARKAYWDAYDYNQGVLASRADAKKSGWAPWQMTSQYMGKGYVNPFQQQLKQVPQWLPEYGPRT